MGSRKPTFAIRSFFQRPLSGAMRELVLSADSVEKLDVAAEVSVHRGWNFEALLFLRLQSGPDARFSC
jgi:hypothetical protein